MRRSVRNPDFRYSVLGFGQADVVQSAMLREHLDVLAREHHLHLAEAILPGLGLEVALQCISAGEMAPASWFEFASGG